MTNKEKLNYIRKLASDYYEYGGGSYEHPEYSIGQLEAILDIILQICDIPEDTEVTA